MKKLLLLLSIVFLTVSCVEDPTEPVNVFSDTYPVEKWVWHPEQLYFYCDFKIPQLTSYVIDYGMINTYYVALIDGDKVLYPLPYDYYDEDNTHRWTEQSTCEIFPGVIRFITKYNDFASYPPPPKMTFRVNMMW